MSKKFLVVLTTGKEDNGSAATLAFSCGLSAIAGGCETTIFMTKQGAVWAFSGNAEGVVVQGFPPLLELVGEYLRSGGRLLACSVCHRSCGNGGVEDISESEFLDGVRIAGLSSAIEIAQSGGSITF